MDVDPRFHKLYGTICDVVLELDADDSIVVAQGDTLGLLGHADLQGQKFHSILHKKDHALHQLVRLKLSKRPKLGPAPLRVVKKDGQETAVEMFCASMKRDGKLVIQMGLRPYQGVLKLPSATSRPPSAAHRLFKEKDFSALGNRLKDYAASIQQSAPAALLKLAGVSEDNEGSIEMKLWALSQLLNDAATEGAGDGDGERQRAQPEQNVGFNADNLGDKMATAFTQEKGEVNYVSFAGAGGLSESDSVKAAVYSMQKAASNARAATVKGLTGNYEKRLVQTKQQLIGFKKIVMQEHFEAALQPIVNIHDGSLHHYEALARFDQNVYQGNPYEFMTFAEDIGVIEEFDLAMALKVIHLIKRVRRIGYDVRIAVNISGKSITSTSFQRNFFRILEDCGDIRRNLMFELTESSQIEDLEATNRILSRIREFGHKVALDDFGAGAAGMQYLRVLKVDCVKIDGVYIRQGLEQEDNKSFLRSMANLCRQLNIETVGECVENEEQRAFLEEIGVNYAQGWLYGKAEPVDEALRHMIT